MTLKLWYHNGTVFVYRGFTYDEFITIASRLTRREDLKYWRFEAND